MHDRAPAWSRLVHRVSRSLNVFDRSQQIVRDELLFAFVPPGQRTDLVLRSYERTSSYSPGGEFFSQGLFPWEVALLNDPRIPRSGRALLTAAGGGRELQALLKDGYEVFAFEPVAPLVKSARDVARGTSAVVVQATYADLVARARAREGGLSSLHGPFDFCLLGWGSLSHLSGPSEVVDVLRALRALAPRAPVMMSFFMRGSGPAPTLGGARRLRLLVRGLLAAAGGQAVPPGLQFHFEGGFVYAFSREEIDDACGVAGYEVAFFTDLDYPHALLLPTLASPVAPAGG